MITKRKLPAMHEVYGIKEGYKCRNCCNLHAIDYYNNHYYKCAAYGDSYSRATDWSANYTACGFFNNPMDGWIPLYEKIKSQRSDGQIAMEVEDANGTE